MSQMLDYVVDRLQTVESGQVAKATGMSIWTVRAIRQGRIKNPGILSVETLYKHFKRNEGKSLRKKRST